MFCRRLVLSLISLLVFTSLLSTQPVSDKFAGDTLGAGGIRVASVNDSAQWMPGPRDSRITWHTFIENIPRDWSQWAQTAFRHDKIGEWALVTGLTTALFVTDDITYTPSKRFFESSGRAGYWSNFAAEIGDGRTQFGLAGAFAAYGVVFGDQRALRTGSQIVEVVLGAGAVVQVLKHVTGRESPFTRSSPTGIWKFFPDQLQYHKHVPAYDAFPSGHICTSMATVVVIAENYPEATWIRPLGYLFCTFIAVGMVNNGIHWYSDYPLGILIGYSFGMIASHQELYSLAGHDDRNPVNLSLAPAISRYGPGLNLRISF